MLIIMGGRTKPIKAICFFCTYLILETNESLWNHTFWNLLLGYIVCKVQFHITLKTHCVSYYWVWKYIIILNALYVNIIKQYGEISCIHFSTSSCNFFCLFMFLYFCQYHPRPKNKHPFWCSNKNTKFHSFAPTLFKDF